MNNNECCLGNILEVINILQNKAERIDDIPSSCDRPFLGVINTNNSFIYNTRPITLYNCNNEAIELPYTITSGGETITGTSNILRVENVNGCCATCMVLAPNPDTTSVLPYFATDTFGTFNLSCIAALTCLDDTYIDCI